MDTKTLDRKALDELSSEILSAAITVHREMGPGLLESVYQQCMIKELQDRDIEVRTMVPVKLFYKGESLNKRYVIDILGRRNHSRIKGDGSHSACLRSPIDQLPETRK